MRITAFIAAAVAAALVGQSEEKDVFGVGAALGLSAEGTSVKAQTVEKFGKKKIWRYAHLHRKWTKRAGARVVGRQIVKYGMPKKGPGNRVATRPEWRRTMRVLERWENPPAPPAPPPTMTSTQPNVGSSYSGGTGQYSIPTDIVMCESGGDYNAQNPSGAYGAYQIMPGTAQAYGCSLATPAGQDACAAKIWNGGAGRSNWVC